MTFEQRLDRITSDRQLHGRFLQHLSALEKSGHQKLLRLKHRWDLTDEDFLGHLVDEARHSAHLKKMAHSLVEDRDNLGPLTKNYLTKLEVFILRALRLNGPVHSEACYVLLTHVIETRAQKLYPLYEANLAQKHSNVSVQNIIDDEGEHLALMRVKLTSLGLSPSILADAEVFEEELFQIFIAQF